MNPKNCQFKAIWILCLIFIIFNKDINAQSSKYSIESFQDTYSELQEYQSIALLTEWNPLWSYEFQLNFPFPFFDSIYTRLFFDRSGWGYFTEDQDLSLFLMEGWSWTYDPYMGNNNPDSDARFAHVISNELQALVIQFTKARIFADLYEDSLDTYLNFQVWLFENGVIEVRFGETHIDGNPIYRPGKSFFCFTTDEGIDTNDICAPRMSIANPFDESDAIGLQGSYNDYEVTGTLYSRLTVMPPHGWVIRFKPKTVGTSEPDYESNEVSISPNPASSFINLTEPGSYINICSLSGQIVYQGIVNETKFDISTFPQGVYFVRTLSDKGASIGKFIKF